MPDPPAPDVPAPPDGPDAARDALDLALGVVPDVPPAEPLDADASAARPRLTRGAFGFLLATAFLGAMGIGLIGPVVPYLVEPYLANKAQLGSVVGWLTASYAICAFLAGPPLGALSDRVGRRPVLLVSLLGSAVGYLVFGLGGSLAVLFLGRIVDGLTAGNFSTVFGYVADTTTPETRGKTFGFVGAAFGAGFIVGPAIGGLAAKHSLAAPVFVAAALTLVSLVWGYVALPESLPPAHRTARLAARDLNPLAQLADLLAMPRVRGLLVAGLLFTLPFAMLTVTLTLLGKTVLGWTASQAATAFVVIGVCEVVVQGGLLGRMIARWGELGVAKRALWVVVTGLVGLALVPATAVALPAAVAWGLRPAEALLYAGAGLFAAGEGMFTASLGTLLSHRVDTSMQGKVQGGAQAMQALGRIGGPIAGGLLFQHVGAGAPYAVGALLVLASAFALRRAPAAEG